MKSLAFGALQLFCSVLAAPHAAPNAALERRSSALAELTGIKFDVSAQMGPELSKRQTGINYVRYDIQLDGRNTDNWEQWVVNGWILITDRIPTTVITNGLNSVDIVVGVGSPAANPISGSIRYASNRYLYQAWDTATINPEPVDYAYVTSDSTKVNVTIDSTLAAANERSNFNARSGVLAGIYEPESGSFQLTVTDTSISGTAIFIGRDYILGGTAPYEAIVTGTFHSSGTLAY